MAGPQNKGNSDAKGYQRGAMGIDGRKGEGFLHKGSDDGNKSAHDILDKVMDVGERGLRYAGVGGYSAGLPRGGADPQRPKGDFGTKSPKAASPSGKYAKPGGKGQRSGA